MPNFPSFVKHRASDLVSLFNQTFSSTEATILQGGGCEPLYQPASVHQPSRIIFRADYYASALHEIAHWCIAGAQRRQWVDYGYWYEPDGRNRQQQQAFESVEVKPQALEWVFSTAAGFGFHLSADNITGLGVSNNFKQAVVNQAQAYCQGTLPNRGRDFAAVLANYYGVEGYLTPAAYQVQALAG